MLPADKVFARLTPQAKAIFSHLLAAGSISNVEAHAVHRCRSVSRRMTEICDAIYYSGSPFDIRKENKKDATGQRYTRYFLERPNVSGVQ
jgi:hypothetical protein